MKSKRKLIIVHTILSKGFAGSEKYMVDLIRYQKKYHTVFAITSQKNKMLNKFLEKEVKVFKIGDLFKKYKINNLINNINPEIVHTHLGNASKIVNKSFNYKTICTLHMNYKATDYKNSDAIIVSNNTQYEEIKNKFKGRLFKSYLWVNLPKVDIAKSKLKKKLNISNKNFVFGSIGRFHAQKGFDIIIKVFKNLKLPNCNLILIGNGHKDFKTLEKTNQNFRIIGHVKNVSNYYNILDAGIFVSRWETFGFSLIEAMKFKIPIISSKHIGNKDWINKFKIFKINHKNENQIKKYIIKLYNSKFSKKKYDLQMFDYKNNCDAITSIYRKILVK
jgi:glycosyltransferase involved in cell wall biosynthesis